VRALPARVRAAREIRRLPGCDAKMARLWREFRDAGALAAAREVEGGGGGDGGQAAEMKILGRFYEIWGVGERTARAFYYDKGWRDLDDVIEYGWSSLTRVQQIGLKFYDEFLAGIPRQEVGFIVDKVREHAVRVRDEAGIELIAVGGYRRGKELSGDVDVIVSHRELDKTAGLVMDIVASLEDEGWITHTLRLDLTGTHRDQETLEDPGSTHWTRPWSSGKTSTGRARRTRCGTTPKPRIRTSTAESTSSSRHGGRLDARC
jgi:DNA polymerase IV